MMLHNQREGVCTKKAEKMHYVNVCKKRMFHVNIYKLFFSFFFLFFSKKDVLR